MCNCFVPFFPYLCICWLLSGSKAGCGDVLRPIQYMDVFLVPPVTKLFFICKGIMWFSRGDYCSLDFSHCLNNSMTTLKELFPYNNHCIIDCWTFLQCCNNCNKHSDHMEISLKFINALKLFCWLWSQDGRFFGWANGWI